MSVSSRVVIVGNLESKSGMSTGKDGKPKPWTRYSLKDQADHFVGSTFSDTIATVLRSNIGQQVTVDVEERENPNGPNPFRDIVGAMPGVVATAADARSVAPNATGGTAPTQAVRIGALQAAVALCVGTGLGNDDILSTADKYVAWITETEQVQHMRSFDPDSVGVPF